MLPQPFLVARVKEKIARGCYQTGWGMEAMGFCLYLLKNGIRSMLGLGVAKYGGHMANWFHIYCLQIVVYQSGEVSILELFFNFFETEG